MKSSIIKTSIAFLAVLGMVISSQAYADEQIGHIISVKKSGWATRMNAAVKKTVKAGDPLYQGDILDVRHGNHLQIALDKNEDNVIHVAGNSLLQIFQDDITNVELTHGKVYALLDDLDTRNGFKISTPTAVSTVRGTYFSTSTNGTVSQTMVYQGRVKMHGRYENGKQTRSAVLLKPTQQSSVQDQGQKPLAGHAMSKADFDEINVIIGQFEKKRELLDYNTVANKNSGHGISKPGSANVDVNGDATSKNQNEYEDQGRVVF